MLNLSVNFEVLHLPSVEVFCTYPLFLLVLSSRLCVPITFFIIQENSFFSRLRCVKQAMTLFVGANQSNKSDLGLSILHEQYHNATVIYIPMADSATCSGLRNRIEGMNDEGVSSFANINNVLQCKSNSEHNCFMFIDDLHWSPQCRTQVLLLSP